MREKAMLAEKQRVIEARAMEIRRQEEFRRAEMEMTRQK